MTTLKFAGLLLLVTLIFGAYAIWDSHNTYTECEKRQGTLVKTMNGWLCVKVQKV